jgi:hypothetical protein
MCHHLEEFRHRRVTTVVYQCKHGGVVQPYPHQMWPPLEDKLQETCKLLQPSKPMQTKWVKENIAYEL